jgi:UDP-N-acetylglucosamine 2-epimerase
VIVSTHPRTRKRLEKFGKITLDKRIQFLKPFGFFDYVRLQKNSLCSISDSGTISEESAILGFPAITIRNAIERPEALDAGTIILTGLKSDTVMDSVALAISEYSKNIQHQIPVEYEIKDTSWRVLKLILGTSGLSNNWHGVKNNDR